MNEIKEELLTKISSIKDNNNVYEFGKIIKIQDYIIEVSGLEGVSFFEKVEIDNKAIGYVSNISKNSIIVSLVKQTKPLVIGDIVKSQGETYKTYFIEQGIGRIIDIFGTDLLTGKKFVKTREINIENPTIPIMDRIAVERPLYTGLSGIDLIYPIGKGQRQLIIGDKKIGKTQILLDTIANQTEKKVVCFYIAIGKNKKELKQIYDDLYKRVAMEYTIILAACNDEKTPVLSLTPYAGLSMAEEYLKLGLDVLVCIDDLKRHANAYREIALLIGKFPGREAYPSDIFYTHSRLLEKGCQHKNGGSITILPVTETKAGDITDYITTNIISITDGQIVLSANNFLKGEKPAIDYGLSVSRLGGAVQDDDIKVVGAKVRRELLSYLETKSVYELANFDEMSDDLKKKILDGRMINQSLQQNKFSPLTKEEIIEKFSFLTGEEK